MNVDKFLAEFPLLWDGDPQDADEPWSVEPFRTLLRTVPGMATVNKLATLNLAAAHLDVGEIYLEVGAWSGCSIIAAAFGNPGRFITIDNFSQFDGDVDQCRRNIDRYGVDVELIDGDVSAVLDSPPFSAPVGVFFYDGDHTYEAQYGAWQQIERLLADDALVIIDDTEVPVVVLANDDFTRDDPRWSLLYEFSSAYNGEPRWWNGIQIYRYRRNAER